MKKVNKTEYVIITDKIEEELFTYELYHYPTRKSKFISKEEADKLTNRYGIASKDIFTWGADLKINMPF